MKKSHHFIFLQDPPSLGGLSESPIGGMPGLPETPPSSPQEDLDRGYQEAMQQGKGLIATSIQAMESTFLRDSSETVETNPFTSIREQVQWCEQIQQGNIPLDMETPDKITFQKTTLENLQKALQTLHAKIKEQKPELAPAITDYAPQITQLFAGYTKAKALTLTKEMKDAYDTLQVAAQKINISY